MQNNRRFSTLQRVVKENFSEKKTFKVRPESDWKKRYLQTPGKLKDFVMFRKPKEKQDS